MFELDSISRLETFIKNSELKSIENIAFQGLDLTAYEIHFKESEITNCFFLGCIMTDAFRDSLLKYRNIIFPEIDLPFKKFRNELYDPASLYNGFEVSNPISFKKTLDYKIYDHYVRNGKNQPNSILEALSRRIHDHSISDALEEFILHEWREAFKIVAFVGSHKLKRDEQSFFKLAKLGKLLSEKGYLVVTGGGPGVMEAPLLGAWFRNKSMEDLESAISILSQAPSHKNEFWLNKAFDVRQRFPKEEDTTSLSIPTWTYGHEPSTPFAVKIAKYFENSLREEGLLAIAKGGVIIAPGGGGTILEIFQEIAQNHNLLYDVASPMIFWGEEYWTNDRPIYPLVKNLSSQNKFRNLNLTLTDSQAEVFRILDAFQKENTG